MTETYTINFHDLILTVKYIDKKWVSRESELEQEIEKFKKQNEIMRQALEFYADIDSWDCPTGLYDVTAIVDDESTHYYSDVAGDFDDVGGKRARQALKDTEGVG